MDKLAYSAYRHLAIIQDVETGELYDVTKLAQEAVYTTEMMTGMPGKLELKLMLPPATARRKGLEFLTIARTGQDRKHGHIVQYSVNGEGVFFGYIVKVGQDELNNVFIHAYDQIFWLKNKDIYYRFDKTASQVFSDVCIRKTHPPLQFRVDTPARAVLDPYNFGTNKTLYDIIAKSIGEANVEENKRFLIRDGFGTLVFTEIGELHSGIRLGAYEYLMAFQYESTISAETYNHIKAFRANEDLGKYDTWVAQDSETMRRWGRLTKLIEADEHLTDVEIIARAEKYLDFFNRPEETMDILALGRLGLYAGNSVQLNIGNMELQANFWIASASHTFKDFKHTMDLQIFYIA